jgi:asparagine synthase (glutamine-hydrolysing)
MSGIFGLVHWDGSPVLEKDLNAMRAAMQEWGPDASGLWCHDSAGLGSLTLFDTPEAIHEQPPIQSAQGFVLTAEARLDNRADLCGELGILAAERPALADGTLVGRAYERWGENTPAHLLGDWSFAAWHPAERRLDLARDHFGNTGLYYYRDERRLAFASSRKALLALGIPRRLNEFFLACVLVSWSAHNGEQTIELDLHRLPPAHTLTAQAGNIRTHEYWRLQDTPELRLKKSQDYVDGLLSVYDRAVRDRLRSRTEIGASLSGGLDSGSTTLLAARALKEQGRRLRAYTSVPLYDVSHTGEQYAFGDELPFARAVASSAGNVDLVEIRAQTITPIQAIRRALEIHVEPGHGAANAYWMIDMLASAHRDGLAALLSGQGGNGTISWPGMDFSGSLRRWIKEHHWVRALQLLIYPYVPVPVLRALRHAFRRDELDWSRTAIHSDFARRIRLGAQFIDGAGGMFNPEDWHRPLQLRYATILPGRSFLGSIWAENGAAHGLDVRDATFDKRVMEFTVSVPDREYAGPDEMERWLIRCAMQGLMPDEVRLNRKRGRQAADLGQRLIQSAAEVDAVLGELESSQLAAEHLALDRMRQVWQSLQDDVNARNSQLAVTILTRGIMAGLYLAGLERAS